MLLIVRQTNTCPEGMVQGREIKVFRFDCPEFRQFLLSIDGNSYAGYEIVGVDPGTIHREETKPA